MRKPIALAGVAATMALTPLSAKASDNPMRDRVQRWEQRALQQALGEDYARLVGPRPEIVGGTKAPAGAWPFQVALLDHSEPSNFQAQFCGGTLVNSLFVITAA